MTPYTPFTRQHHGDAPGSNQSNLFLLLTQNKCLLWISPVHVYDFMASTCYVATLLPANAYVEVWKVKMPHLFDGCFWKVCAFSESSPLSLPSASVGSTAIYDLVLYKFLPCLYTFQSRTRCSAISAVSVLSLLCHYDFIWWLPGWMEADSFKEVARSYKMGQNAAVCKFLCFQFLFMSFPKN